MLHSGGGDSTGFMCSLDDALTINSLSARGIDWPDLRKKLNLN